MTLLAPSPHADGYTSMRSSVFARMTLGLKLGAVIALCVAITIALTTALFVRQAQIRADAQARGLAEEAAMAAADRVAQGLAVEFRDVRAAADGLGALRAFDVTEDKASEAIARHLIASSANQRASWIVWRQRETPSKANSGSARPADDTAPSTVQLMRWERVGGTLVTSAQSASADLPLYQDPLARGQAFVSEPYYLLDAEGGHVAVISYSEPILAGGTVVGAVGVDVAVEPLQQAIGRIQKPKGSELTLASNQGTVVATTQPSLANMSLQEARTGLTSAFRRARQNGRLVESHPVGDADYVRSIQPITFSSVKTPWYVVVDAPLKAFATKTTDMPMLAPAVLALLCLLGLILLAMRIIVTKPLRSIEHYIRTLRDPGSLAVLDLRRSDEIGSIAKALTAFKRSEFEVEKLKSAKAENEFAHAAARRQELKAVADALAQSVQAIAGVVDRSSNAIMRRAESMALTAGASAEKAKIIVGASAAAGSSVSAVDIAAGHLQRSIDQITFEAEDARNVASRAAQQAKESTTVTAALSTQASQIGAVVETISKIAQRTNLLALNATIEAARSGEAGRAFAIVAQEVKALAAQTAAATDEIALQIDGMQTTAAIAATTLASISATVERIDQISTTISNAVTLQGEATESIAGYVSSAVTATRHVDSAIEEVGRCTDDAGRAAAEMLQDISVLTNVSKQLNEQVSEAIARIRTAQAA